MIDTLYEPFKHWSEGGSIYIISDTHFGDPDCKLMNHDWPDPEDAADMISAVVKKDDTLIILGDVGELEFVRYLNVGRKILITGNHDAGVSKYQRVVHVDEFDPKKNDLPEIYRDMLRRFPDSFIDVERCKGMYYDYWQAVADNALFDEVYTGPLVIAEKIILSHEPIELPFFVNIHGHVHNGQMRYKNAYGCNCLNVASDVCGFKPINLGKEIKKGLLAGTPSIHRVAIDKARENPVKRCDNV